LRNYKILNTKTDQDWHLHIIAVPEPNVFIAEIQQAMMSDKPFYFHVYDNGASMKIVFKGAVFRVNPNNKNTWVAAQKYGLSLNITRSQLDFFPTRIREEEKWL
jgi:hypothetical protein